MLFSDWLPLQKNRTDSVGELARLLLKDVTGPLWANNPEAYRCYLTARGAQQAQLTALECAVAEWTTAREAGDRRAS
jgi:hypothetical protein